MKIQSTARTVLFILESFSRQKVNVARYQSTYLSDVLSSVLTGTSGKIDTYLFAGKFQCTRQSSCLYRIKLLYAAETWIIVYIRCEVPGPTASSSTFAMTRSPRLLLCHPCQTPSVEKCCFRARLHKHTPTDNVLRAITST